MTKRVKRKSGKKKNTNKCATKFCRNTRGHQRRLCYKCTKRKYGKNNPEMDLFHCRKSNAKKRGIEWLISFEEFKKFIHETGYIDKRGIKPGSMTIDRKKDKDDKGNKIPYTIDTIQILSHAHNSTKEFLEKMGIPFYGGEVPF